MNRSTKLPQTSVTPSWTLEANLLTTLVAEQQQQKHLHFSSQNDTLHANVTLFYI